VTHIVEFIPAEWLERSMWAAVCGERLEVYSRPVRIERRWLPARRQGPRHPAGRRAADESPESFQSLNLAELLLV